MFSLIDEGLIQSFTKTPLPLKNDTVPTDTPVYRLST